MIMISYILYNIPIINASVLSFARQINAIVEKRQALQS